MKCYTCSESLFFFFKQKTAYEMRISDWSSDVCSSDLCGAVGGGHPPCAQGADRRLQDSARLPFSRPTAARRQRENLQTAAARRTRPRSRGVGAVTGEIGRASCGERVCQYV